MAKCVKSSWEGGCSVSLEKNLISTDSKVAQMN